MGTGGPFPGLKRSLGVMLTTYSHLVPRSRLSRSYISSTPKRLHSVQWDSFSFNGGGQEYIERIYYFHSELDQ
jgi:hypothetical protein